MPTTLADILTPALRMAGISKRPGITPSGDQFQELIPAANRMLSSWNCNGHLVFTTSIVDYDLNAGQEIYSIGPGGDLNGARPISIRAADFIYPTNPSVRRPIQILDDEQWSKVSVQSISGAPPWYLYPDYGYDANGRSLIYLVGQPPTGYQLELYIWQALKSDFSATTDAVIFPPGYEKALVSNLALEAVMLYPLESVVATNPRALDKLERQAGKDLRALIVLNSTSPILRSEIAYIGRAAQGGAQGLVVSGNGGGGSGTTWISPTNSPDGSATVFSFSQAPQFCEFNGLLQFTGAASGVPNHAGYELVTATSVRFIDNDGNVITPGSSDSIKAAV